MKGELNRKRVMMAKRLFFAESSMNSAMQLAKYAIDNKCANLPDVFYAMMAGICVTYCRPFLRADGLGPLNDRFTTFSESALQETHDDLLRTRHSFYAHRDLTATRAINPVTVETIDMHAVILRFNGIDEYTFRTREPHYRDINLPAIVSLCSFQQSRIAKERHSVIDRLCKGKCPSLGDYELGKDFP